MELLLRQIGFNRAWRAITLRVSQPFSKWGFSRLKMENEELMFLNAICGITIVVIIFLKTNSILLGSFMLVIPLLFFLGHFEVERQRITKHGYRPPTRSIEMIKFDRVLGFGLFVLNLVAFFILWFPPPFPSDYTTAVWQFFLYFGLIWLLLKWDLGKLGTEVARGKYLAGESQAFP